MAKKKKNHETQSSEEKQSIDYFLGALRCNKCHSSLEMGYNPIMKWNNKILDQSLVP